MKLLTGTGYTFLAGYAGKLILARLYPVGAFGLFEFITTIVSLLAPVVSLRYEDALMLPKSNRRSVHAYLLALMISAILSSLLWLFLPFRHQFSAFFSEPLLGDWLWIIPVLLIVTRYARISELWLSRQQNFGLISGGQITNTSMMIGYRIGVGFYAPGPGGLIYGYLIAYVSSGLFYLKKVRSTVREALGEGFSFGLVKEIARRYRRFPAFTMPAAVVSMGGLRMPALILMYSFGRETLGFYAWAYSVLFIPLSMIGTAISQVFFVRAAEAIHKGTLAQVTDTIHKRLVLIAWFPTIALMLSGPQIYSFLFGEKWLMAGEMVRFLAPWVLLATIASPISRLFDVLERQRLELVNNTGMFVVFTTALIIGSWNGNVMTMLWMLGIFGALVRGWQVFLLLHIARVPPGRMVAPYVRYGLQSVPFLFAVWLSVVFLSNFGVTVVTVLAGIGFLLVAAYREGLLSERPVSDTSGDTTVDEASNMDDAPSIDSDSTEHSD